MENQEKIDEQIDDVKKELDIAQDQLQIILESTDELSADDFQVAINYVMGNIDELSEKMEELLKKL
jgi:uncharacterized protein YoxC